MTAPRIRQAGDAALLLELEPVIDAYVNARALAIADAVRVAAIPGVRDVVATFRSVAVYFDPLHADAAAIHSALAAAADAPAAPMPGRSHQIDVVYGGDAGPDLDALAAQAALSAQAVVERHCGREYRVFMLGFLPGFAYMGTVDEQIAAARHATPRFHVAAGSVGIAGRQTGIYPIESPGGWQIIGRTTTEIFDVARTPAALFAPGDTVRFVPVSGPAEAGPHDRTAVGAGFSRPARTVTVLRPGLLTTVQDRGRWGHFSSGVPAAGALDMAAHDAANAAVGNDPDAATLEVTLQGPELRVEQPTTVAVGGADLNASVGGAPLAPGLPRRCGAGDVVRFGERRAGARAYVAFDGGIDAAPILRSRATHLPSRMGGIDGRPLAAGDVLPLGGSQSSRAATIYRRPLPAGGARLRVLPGPQDDLLPRDTIDLLQRTRFSIATQSNRMGYRLSGARLPASTGEMISDATFAGAIQVPPSGEPILLLADRQTTGGYPQVATVITADLPLAGQLAPGDWVEFAVCDRADALAALRQQDQR